MIDYIKTNTWKEYIENSFLFLTNRSPIAIILTFFPNTATSSSFHSFFFSCSAWLGAFWPFWPLAIFSRAFLLAFYSTFNLYRVIFRGVGTFSILQLIRASDCGYCFSSGATRNWTTRTSFFLVYWNYAGKSEISTTLKKIKLLILR